MMNEREFKLLEAEVLGQKISLETQKGLFSPEHIDRGTLAMLSHVKFDSGMRIMDLGCGCGIVGIIAAKIAGEENVFMSDADPKAVETAKQTAEAVVNEAKAYENAQIPNAEAQADKLLQNAEYLKTKRINEAVETVAMFEAMFIEYEQNPEITRSRMYYEAISRILPDVKVYINTGSGSDLDMLLPLESLMGGK